MEETNRTKLIWFIGPLVLREEGYDGTIQQENILGDEVLEV